MVKNAVGKYHNVLGAWGTHLNRGGIVSESQDFGRVIHVTMNVIQELRQARVNNEPSTKISKEQMESSLLQPINDNKMFHFRFALHSFSFISRTSPQSLAFNHNLKTS